MRPAQGSEELALDLSQGWRRPILKALHPRLPPRTHGGLWVGLGPGSPGGSAGRPELRTGALSPHFGEGINQGPGGEAGKGPGGCPSDCWRSWHTTFPCLHPQSRARLCTQRTHLQRDPHSPAHAVTNAHVHAQCFLPAEPGGRDLRRPRVGAGPGRSEGLGPGPRGALLRVTAPSSPRRAARLSLRLFVMLIPLPSWCQLPAQ